MQYDEFRAMNSAIVLAATARPSAQAIALNAVARWAIFNDPTWRKGEYRKNPKDGLALARGQLAVPCVEEYLHVEAQRPGVILPAFLEEALRPGGIRCDAVRCSLWTSRSAGQVGASSRSSISCYRDVTIPKSRKI